MRKTMYLVAVALLAFLTLLSACQSAPAPTSKPTPVPAPATPAVSPKPAASPAVSPAPAKSPLPQVPITYAGDTDATIIRRAQWMEAAKKEGKVVWWNILSAKEGGDIAAEFNKIYPDIKVERWETGGTELATKMEAQFIAGRLDVDVTTGGEQQNFPRWRQMDMLQKFTDILPGLEKLEKRLYGKYGDWAVPGCNAAIPAYNTRLISAAEAPKSWEDLLNPRWKGQIAVTTQLRQWAALAVEEGGWGVKETEQFLTRLKAQEPVWSGGFSAAHALMVAGEVKIHALSFLRHTLQAQEKKAPAEWVRASPVPVTAAAVIIPKKAPHPNAASLFLEWMFSPQGLATYEKITYYGTVGPGSTSQLSKGVAGLRLALQTEEGVQKATELGLYEKYPQIFGLAPSG